MNTTLSFGDCRGYRAALRGDYMTVYVATGETESYRVIGHITTTLTVRTVSSWRSLEWLRARCEDWALWPLADLKTRLRVRA